MGWSSSAFFLIFFQVDFFLCLLSQGEKMGRELSIFFENGKSQKVKGGGLLIF
jgi:hypothetical protein